MTPPVPPEKDIGPFYKLIGALLALGALGLFLIHAHIGKDNTWVDLTMAAIILLFVLSLWRPDKFDELIKSIADKLPFLSYKKE